MDLHSASSTCQSFSIVEKLHAFFKSKLQHQSADSGRSYHDVVDGLTVLDRKQIITQQFENQAAITLRNADRLFLARKSLFEELSNLSEFGEGTQLQSRPSSSGLAHVEDFIQQFPADFDVDVAFFTSSVERPGPAKRDRELALGNSKRTVFFGPESLHGEESRNHPVGHRLFGVVSFPMFGRVMN